MPYESTMEEMERRAAHMVHWRALPDFWVDYWKAIMDVSASPASRYITEQRMWEHYFEDQFPGINPLFEEDLISDKALQTASQKMAVEIASHSPAHSNPTSQSSSEPNFESTSPATPKRTTEEHVHCTPATSEEPESAEKLTTLTSEKNIPISEALKQRKPIPPALGKHIIRPCVMFPSMHPRKRVCYQHVGEEVGGSYADTFLGTEPNISSLSQAEMPATPRVSRDRGREVPPVDLESCCDMEIDDEPLM